VAHSLSRRDFIHRAKGVALATPFISLVGCGEESVRDLLSLGGQTMGTTYSVKLVNVPTDLDQDTLAQELDGILETVNRRMSTYRPDSELSRYNAAAAEDWLAVSSDTRSVIDEALRVARLTGGAFDPTVGPVVDLWGFGAAGKGQHVPSPEDIAAARETIGFAKVETRDAPAQLTKLQDGVRLDLSGVAKGFAVDKLAAHLDAQGMTDYLVEVGGELRTGGHGPEGRPWRVGIEKPTMAPGDLQRIVDLERDALATSGNYRIFFEQDGRRYTHIVNPRNCRPVEHDLASATVVAATTMEADALSTSLLVLGPEAGMELAVEQDIAAFFVVGRDGSFSEMAAPAFERRFTA